MPWRVLLPISLVLFAIFAGFSAVRGPVAVAKAAPITDAKPGDPPLIDLAGYKDVVAKYHGKGLLVTFWATWCPAVTNIP
jgi:hypothetical protein